MFAVGLIFSITVPAPSLGILKLSSGCAALMIVGSFVAADTKNKVLASNLHQRSRVGSPEKWAAVSPGISN